MAVTAAVVPPVITVAPGESVSLALRLVNDGQADETLRLAIEGDAAPFSWIAEQSVTVPAGGTKTVKLGFRGPPVSVVAGPKRFRVRAGSVVAEGVLEVAPAVALSASLDADGTQVTVATRGNAPVEVDLSATNASVEPATVTVTPDRPATARVAARGGKRPLVGKAQTRTFSVKAVPRVGAPAEVTGSFVERALVPARAAIAAAVAVALVLAGVAIKAVGGGGGEDEPETVASGDALDPVLRDRCPAEFHRDVFGVRGLQPEEINRLPDSYTFLRVKEDNCTPMRMNPCEPVHYIQNAAAAPPAIAADVREAFRMLSEATGITFVDDGVTDENLRAGPYVPERYGQRWAPILILWEHFPVEQTEGARQIFGNTNVMRVEDIVVSGRLRFNLDAYNDETTRAPIEPGFGPPAGSGTGPIGRQNVTWGRIVLHELAHLVGLGHNRDEGSLMYPDAAQQTIRPTGFSEGDRLGLRFLGREAGCLRTPALPRS